MCGFAFGSCLMVCLMALFSFPMRLEGARQSLCLGLCGSNTCVQSGSRGKTVVLDFCNDEEKTTTRRQGQCTTARDTAVATVRTSTTSRTRVRHERLPTLSCEKLSGATAGAVSRWL